MEHWTNLDFSDLELNGQPLPKYVMDQWINGCTTGRIDLDQIHAIDLIPLLKFIDQYPTKTISISLLEGMIASYFNKTMKDQIIPQIVPWYTDPYVKNIIMRYGLKIMYLEMHNHQLIVNRIKTD